MQFRFQRGGTASTVLWEMEVPRSRVLPEVKGATHGDGVRPGGEFRVSAFGIWPQQTPKNATPHLKPKT